MSLERNIKVIFSYMKGMYIHTHTYIHYLIHTYIHTYIHTHTYIT
jgi:hypothetical protein